MSVDKNLIREIEALKVGADEVLILRVPETWSGASEDDPIETLVEKLAQALKDCGLKERSLVIMADDVEFAKVQK